MGARAARSWRARRARRRAPVPLETRLSGVEVAVLDPDEVFHFFHMIASKCWPSPRAPADGGNSRDAGGALVGAPRAHAVDRGRWAMTRLSTPNLARRPCGGLVDVQRPVNKRRSGGRVGLGIQRPAP